MRMANLLTLIVAFSGFQAGAAQYVRTPDGLFPSSCVQNVGNHAQLDEDKITYADGKTAVLTPCGTKHDYTPPSSWVMDSIATSSAPAVHMTATFIVPAAPTNSEGQTVFLFPGLRPANGASVLQPVLQWGNGTPAWEIASWSCAAVSGGPCPHSDYVSVNSGDEIFGEILGNNCSTTGQCEWTITSTDKTTGQSTTLTTKHDKRSYVLLFGGVLESYGISQCNDYPSNGNAMFSNINFYDAQNNLLAPSWSPQYDDTTYCNLSIHTTATTTELDFPSGG